MCLSLLWDNAANSKILLYRAAQWVEKSGFTSNFSLQQLAIYGHNKCMKFENLLALVGDQPFFETGLLLAGNVDPAHVRRQLSRWVRSGRVRQQDSELLLYPHL